MHTRKIARFNSFGNGSCRYPVHSERYFQLKSENIVEFTCQSRQKNRYKNLSRESLFWINYQPKCTEDCPEMKNQGKLFNGIYQKIANIQITESKRDNEIYYTFKFRVKRLDKYYPFKFKLNDKNGLCHWESPGKNNSSSNNTIVNVQGSIGKIDKKVSLDVINHIKLNMSVKIQRWFRKIQAISLESNLTSDSELDHKLIPNTLNLDQDETETINHILKKFVNDISEFPDLEDSDIKELHDRVMYLSDTILNRARKRRVLKWIKDNHHT